MTLTRDTLVAMLIGAVLAAMLVFAFERQNSTASTQGAVPTVCSMDGNFANDTPGCVNPKSRP